MVTLNVILWNVMIFGYVKNGYVDEVVELFKEMIIKNIKSDFIIVRVVILVCV